MLIRKQTCSETCTCWVAEKREERQANGGCLSQQAPQQNAVCSSTMNCSSECHTCRVAEQ